MAEFVSEVCQCCLNTGLQVECLGEVKMLWREVVRSLKSRKGSNRR